MALMEYVEQQAPGPVAPDEEQGVPQRIALEDMRRRRMMTQIDLANAAGLNVSTVRAIEQGKATARFRTIQRICEALHCRPEEIDWHGNPLRLKPDEDP